MCLFLVNYEGSQAGNPRLNLVMIMYHYGIYIYLERQAEKLNWLIILSSLSVMQVFMKTEEVTYKTVLVT